MAELLIRLKNNTNPDPAKDRMCYKHGDVVVVKPDGHIWGREEGAPDFAVIQTDKTVAQMGVYLNTRDTEIIESQEVDATDLLEMYVKGEYLDFTRKPIEGKTGVRYDKRRRINVPTVIISGPVIRPHTRRKWGLNFGAFTMKAERDLRVKGRAVIPFSELRIALKDKKTGVRA